MSIQSFENILMERLNAAGSDKISDHQYQLAYKKFLVGKNVKSFLEIGIANQVDGHSSITAWSELFPTATIYALDNDQKKVTMVNGGRVKAYNVDQSSLDSLLNFLDDADIKYIDVILDDGSHKFSHARTTFEVLFHHLSDDGIYMIEDIKKSSDTWQQSIRDWKNYLDAYDDLEYEIIDCRPGIDDDSIIVGIWKK